MQKYKDLKTGLHHYLKRSNIVVLIRAGFAVRTHTVAAVAYSILAAAVAGDLRIESRIFQKIGVEDVQYCCAAAEGQWDFRNIPCSQTVRFRSSFDRHSRFVLVVHQIQ